MLKLKLVQAISPAAVDEEVICGICGRGFSTGLVQAFRDTCVHSVDPQETCLDCARYLHSANPERFPSVEEKLVEWTTPEFSSMEESDRALGFG